METAETNPKTQPTWYSIWAERGRSVQWAEWFENLILTQQNRETLLTGLEPDQAALHGLLTKVRALGLPLISDNPVEPGPSAAFLFHEIGQTDRPDVKLQNETLSYCSNKEI